MAATAEVIEAEARDLFERSLPPPTGFWTRETLPECFKGIWRLKASWGWTPPVEEPLW